MDRRVVAVSHVSALLVPRYVLLQRGRGNLWPRIRRFLNSRFPTQVGLGDVTDVRFEFAA